MRNHLGWASIQLLRTSFFGLGPVSLCALSSRQQSGTDAVQAAGGDRPKPLTSAQAGRTGSQGRLWHHGAGLAVAWAPNTQSPPAGRAPETGCHSCLPAGQMPALTFGSKAAEHGRWREALKACSSQRRRQVGAPSALPGLDPGTSFSWRFPELRKTDPPIVLWELETWVCPAGCGRWACC